MSKYANKIETEYYNRMYDLIDNPKKKYGEYRKCEFHIHTPASNCYRFIKCDGKEEELENTHSHKSLSVEEVVNYSKKCGYMTDSMYKQYLESKEYFSTEDYLKELRAQKVPYDSFKEYIMFMTIAHKLYNEKIEIAVISDHNTIDGYAKLEYAVDKYYKERVAPFGKRIEVILGVEISCADRVHLVVIYDKEKKEELQTYLTKNIKDSRFGTIKNSMEVIKDMQQHPAISYIAHINSLTLANTGLYKQELFSQKGLKGIGITNIETIERELNKVNELRKTIDDISVIHEGDSHSINDIGLKNCWIKFSKINFQSFEKAFLNHRVSISNLKPQKVDTYIKGIVVDPGEDGFLCSSTPKNKQNNRFVLDFSSDLNCIVGGKGTGKSTVLSIIETIYSQQTDNLEMLKFISKNKIIYSLFCKDGHEYLLKFVPQTIYNNYNIDQPILKRNSYQKQSTSRGMNYYKIDSQWYDVYKLEDINGNRRYLEVNPKEISHILRGVFRRGYNINSLVNKISNGYIGEYIKDVVTYSVKYKDISNYIQKLKSTPNTRFFKYLRENLIQIINLIDERKSTFESLIKDFNEENIDVLQLKFKSIDSEKSYFNTFLDIFEIDENGKEIGNKKLANTYLTWNGVQKFFMELQSKIGYFEILELMLKKNFMKLEKHVHLVDFETISTSFKNVDIGLEHISSKNLTEVYNIIFKTITSNRKLVQDSIIECFKILDEFDIEFNVNSKEDVRNTSPDFKSIRKLSLGQKVASLLTFVFKFGIINNDNTTLIIDQPEDNLDNTYIYKTLVESLKSVKDSRQVIIVTHSSTIVTNANAEQVIVMKADGKNGWKEKVGYPTEPVIIKHIINYLEGGEDSFKHKVDMYKSVINFNIS